MKQSEEHYLKLRKKYSNYKIQFIKKARDVHGFKYNYINSIYINNKTKLEIICKYHGIFYQRPDNHIGLKHGCPKCKSECLSNRLQSNNLDFINKANLLYNNKYNYSLVKYINSSTKVNIICKTHGLFKQTPNSHLLGKEGCKKCSNKGTSKLEQEVYEYTNSIIYCENNVKGLIDNYELDIYIPELNKAIEVNGFWWHYDKSNKLCKSSGYHGLKSNLCRNSGINLLHIREDLWLINKQKMKNVINEFIRRKTNRIFKK